jgi:hypothetical protein
MFSELLKPFYMYPLNPETMAQIQKFTQRLNSQPDPLSIEQTPDRKASTVVISHIEMTLDELFFGQWKTENFKWSPVANEIQGALELVVIHPVTGYEIRRTGAASIVIMVDRAPENLAGQERNQWALNPSNKKPNALDMAFGKLKSECLKNAAQSLGPIFGRDLNRKNKDVYKPFKIPSAGELPEALIARLEVGILNGDPQAAEAIKALEAHLSPEQKTNLQTLLIQKENGN